MKQTFGEKQIVLKYIYESAQRRMKAHPDLAGKYKKMIDEYQHYTNIEDAEQAARAIEDRTHRSFSYDMLGKVAKDGDYYYIDQPFLVLAVPHTDSGILSAAEYIGMELIG